MKRTYVSAVPSSNASVAVVVPTYRARSLGLFIIRAGIGACMIVYGWPKLTGGKAYWHNLGEAVGYFGIHLSYGMTTALGFVAALAEFAGGALLVAGLLTRFIAFVLVVQMVVAISFHLHQTDPVMHAFLTGWSHALVLGFVFLGLVFTGPGSFSVDHLLFGRRVISSASGYDVTTTTEHIPGPSIERPGL